MNALAMADSALEDRRGRQLVAASAGVDSALVALCRMRKEVDRDSSLSDLFVALCARRARLRERAESQFRYS